MSLEKGRRAVVVFVVEGENWILGQWVAVVDVDEGCNVVEWVLSRYGAYLEILGHSHHRIVGWSAYRYTWSMRERKEIECWEDEIVGQLGEMEAGVGVVG